MIKVGAEREIRWQPELREERQKNYDITQYESIHHRFCTGEYDVYKNFNFSIFISDYCNADCKFCVAQLRYANKGLMYQKEKLPDDQWLTRCREILEMIRPLNPSISITGGEPTMSKKLIPVLEMVNELGFRKRTITTNGSHLFDKVGNKMVIDHLMDNGWNHLNISRPAISDEAAKRLMRFNNEEGFCSNEMMRDIIDITNHSDMKHRISCLLLKEEVNSVEKMKEYLDTYIDMGANNFIFRELMDFDTTAINLEKTQYCVDNKVKLNDIWAKIDNYPEFEKYLNILGYYYYVEIYKYRGATVSSEGANMVQQGLEVKNHPNRVYEAVFHPNGNLCASWIDKERILDPYYIEHKLVKCRFGDVANSDANLNAEK